MKNTCLASINVSVLVLFSMILMLICSCSASKTGDYSYIRHIAKNNTRQYQVRELPCVDKKTAHKQRFIHATDNHHLPKRKGTRLASDPLAKKLTPVRQKPVDSTMPTRIHYATSVSAQPIISDLKTISTGKVTEPDRDNQPAQMMDNETWKGYDQQFKGNRLAETARMKYVLTESRGSEKELFIYLAAILAGFLSFLGIRRTREFSTRVASWAYLNPWKTRLIIAVMHLFMGSAAVFFGQELASEGIRLSEQTKNIGLIIFSASALLYPVRKAHIRLFKDSYLRRKLHDIIMVLSACILMLFAGNHGVVRLSGFPEKAGTTLELMNNGHLVSSGSGTNTLLLQQDEDTQDAPKKPIDKSTRIILTILLVLGFLASAFGLFALSCSLACNGLEVLAVLVGLVGGVIITFGLIMGLKGIKYMAKQTWS